MNTVPQHPGRKISHAGMACMLFALLASAGCDTRTADPGPGPATSNPPVANPAASKSTSSSHDAIDAAKYEFHRNVAFTDVTKDLPEGSVDYIDMAGLANLSAKPNVIVVVTVTPPQRDSVRFTTTFIGPNELRIKKQWDASLTDHDGKCVGLFVLPAEVNSASTIVE